jgi:hypothetical protein
LTLARSLPLDVTDEDRGSASEDPGNASSGRAEPPDATDIVELPGQFLLAVRRGEPRSEIVDRIADLDGRELLTALDDDRARLTFWTNLYNAVAQHALETDPDRYESSREFFSAPLVTVAGEELSLDDIEHGILRRSFSKLALGYLRSPFRTEFCERHELDSRDPRIHFALNCGAESCPPIAAYTVGAIDEQLDWATEGYLAETVEYDPQAGRVRVPRVMLWFRGDFGRKRDIVAFLERYGQLPPGASPRLSYRDWDWSMDRGRYADVEVAGEE